MPERLSGTMTKGNITIRPATLADAHALHTLGQNVEEFTTSEATVTFWPESILKASIATDTVIILIAETSRHELIGFIIVNCNAPLRKAQIENIYVHPDKRGQNTGTRLVLAALEEAKKRGYEFISVLIPPDATPAIRTYEKAGFIKGEEFLWLDYSDSTQFRRVYEEG